MAGARSFRLQSSCSKNVGGGQRGGQDGNGDRDRVDLAAPKLQKWEICVGEVDYMFYLQITSMLQLCLDESVMLEWRSE